MRASLYDRDFVLDFDFVQYADDVSAKSIVEVCIEFL